MILLAGACTAVIVSGQRLFVKGSQTANTQLETNALQTTIIKSLPNMSVVTKKTSPTDVQTVKTSTEGVGIFLEDGKLTIRRHGSNVTINSVAKFECGFKKVGANDTGRTQFVYEATMSDGTKISGGVVLINTKHSEVESIALNAELTADTALYFSMSDE